ncbi:putative rRNA maturation factor [Aestuariispira insulae]|uniref:Endoribonuclease YbeY n=2 Tax=Aestuariispira insulae TaxID=1461337 RepID=A0A3D9HPT2_9PROT|nr:putative rRNA maturation factor [Aestuariispira insulae]
MDLVCEADGWPADAEAVVERAVMAAWQAEGGADEGREAELSLVLSDDASVQELNREWRGKDKPTNVLSFPADDEDEAPLPGMPRMLGDIVLALETVSREAREQNKSFDHHLTHLVIHGLLHLIGYDHIEDDEAEIMEALEIKLLAGMGISNPYEGGYQAPDAEFGQTG